MGCSPSRLRRGSAQVHPGELQRLKYGEPKGFETLQTQVDALSSRVAELEQQIAIGGAGAAGGDGRTTKKMPRSQTRVMMEESNRVSGQGEQQRAAFLKEKWLPFVDELKEEYRQARSRGIGGFSPEEILSPQAKMQGWSDRCLELTAEWHGRPNLSLMYEFLVETATLDPSTPYKFMAVPHERSADNWIRVIDGEVRGSFYTPTDDKVHEAIGGMKQSVGESAIANTQLVGMMSAGESRLLLAGGAMKGFLIKKLAGKQRATLTQLGEALRGAEAAGCGLTEFAELRSLGGGKVSQDTRDSFPPPKVTEMLKRCEKAVQTAVEGEAAAQQSDDDRTNGVLAAAMKSCKIDMEGLAWMVLRDLGSPVASYGQLNAEQKEAIHSYLKTELDDGDGEGEKDEMDLFVQFCREHPGSMYKSDPVLHKKMIMSVTLSKKYKVVSKAEVEKHTVHRFLPTEWLRVCALVSLDEHGQQVEIRPPGVEEESRFRANKFPYAEAHGIGLSGGGLDVSLQALAGKTEAQITAAAGSKLKNWWLTDIEKVLVESEKLNPATTNLLPFEAFHEVGQNVKAASSIGATQHSQVNRSELIDWPVLQLQHSPTWVSSLDATLDIVQVGDSVDAFYIKLVTARPSYKPIVEMLTELRILLLNHYGAKRVDFDVHCCVDRLDDSKSDTSDLDFVVTFNPVASIEEDPSRKHSYRNGASGATSCDYNIPCQTVDSSQGKGNMMVWGKADWNLGLTGREVLERLYDFNAVPGIRKVVRKFLMTKFAYVDSSGRAELSQAARINGHRAGGDDANSSPISEW